MQINLEESTTDHVTRGDCTSESNARAITEQIGFIEVAINAQCFTSEFMAAPPYLVEEYARWKVGTQYELSGGRRWYVWSVGLEHDLRTLRIDVADADDEFCIYFFYSIDPIDAHYLLLLNEQMDVYLYNCHEYSSLRHEGLEQIIVKPVMEAVETVQETQRQLVDTAADVQKVAHKADKLVNHIQEQMDALRGFAVPPTEDVQTWEGLLSRAEDFIICISGITSARSIPSVICAIMAYLKTFVRGSMTRVLSGHITDFIRGLYDACTKNLKHESGERAVDFIGLLKDNWQALRQSNILRNLSGSLTAIMAICYGGSRDVVDEFNRRTGGLFSVKMWDFTRGCTGLVDLILTSVHFFLSKGVAIMNGADISILLYDDDKFEELDNRYSRIISWQKLVDRNELDAIDIHTNGEFKTREAFTRAIGDLKLEFIAMKKSASENMMKATLAQRIFRLDSMVSAIMLLQRKKTFIKRAFTNLIFGGSGVAKTFVRILQYKAVCAGLGIDDGNEFLSIPNESEVKYDSEYNPSKHHSMLIDDLCNTKYEWYSESPLNRVLRCNNNTPSSVLKAEADEKGLYQYNLRALYATTNVKDVGSSVFSNNAASIMRRFDYVTTVKLKKEFTNSEGTFYNPTGDVYPSAWHFKVERVVVKRSCVHEGEDLFSFLKVLETDDVWEFTEFMGNAARQHDKEQEDAYVKADQVEKDSMCEHFRIVGHCTKCACNLKKESRETDPIPVNPGITEELHLLRREQGNVKPFSEFWKEAPWFVKTAYTIHGAAHFLARSPPVQIAMGVGLVLLAKQLLVGNSLIAPQSAPTAPVPDSEEHGNAWSKKKITRMPMPLARTMKSASTDPTDLVNCMKKSIMAAALVYTNKEGLQKQQNFNMVPLVNNFWLCNCHSIRAGVLRMANVASNRVGIECVEQRLSESDIYRIPDTDIGVVKVTALPVKRGYLDYFPTGLIPNDGLYTTCVTRVRRDWLAESFLSGDEMPYIDSAMDENGLLMEYARMSELKPNVAIEGKKYPGYLYQHSACTFAGMCGSPYIVNTKGTVILGIHSGGDGKHGFCHAITRGQIINAIEALREETTVTFEGYVTSPQYGYSFEQETLMKDGEEEDDVPPDHPFKFVPEEEPCVVDVFGPHDKGRRSLRSNVHVTPISDTVAEVMNTPREHGKPRHISTWRPWQQNLMNIIQPKNLLDPDVLLKARNSLKKRSLHLVDELKCSHYLHVWDYDSCVNGVDCVNGADRICVATSAGIPVCKSKRVLAEGYALVDEYGTIVELKLSPEVREQVDDLITKAKRGERMYTLFQAHVKDEATKFTKDKLRIFAGTQLAFLLVCKMYLGGLNRMYQNYWDRFECCISANCYNSDWTKLHDSLFTPETRHRVFAGDYKNWDKFQSPQITMATADVHMAILRHSGNYDDEDMLVVKALYTEFAYPVYEWDGIYFQAYGSLPSGVFATVMVSNANNSILFRYTYMQEAPVEELDNYDEYFRANFMGDDNIGSVDPRCTWWNMHKHRDHLAKAGITYTSADKHSALTEWVSLEDATFLKRKFVWSDEVQQVIAPLEEASIFKSLHCYMKRKNCDEPIERICGSSVDSALREFFRHGKEVYETRKAQLERVAQIHDLLPYIALASNDRLPSYETMLTFYLQGEPVAEAIVVECLKFE